MNKYTDTDTELELDALYEGEPDDVPFVGPSGQDDLEDDDDSA